ncbi:acetoin utilization protein AcuC [Epibacterium sp. SM1979]|uniref:Acetoin utilization protein AcuC n=1 Tax=Tritonibacter litoralis TaxID=2662264 RepID=A0A843YIG8_9RHOB|nr:acetoin utilization protein AcuC [Tritonibacter litoralis]MQQ08537.1 acetoin utilization protein AcuC [Tritonibacter litoralis]
MLHDPLFIGHDIYRLSSYGKSHPLRVPRVSSVMDLSRALGWLPPSAFRRAPRAKPRALEAWHHPDYIAALVAAEQAQQVTEDTRKRHQLGTHSNPVFAEMFRRPATSAGASILAGELLARGGQVYNPAGGTHHGMPDRANGFCYLNDPVLAILSLRHQGVRRVVYVDIDAHHPDGVEVGFQGDPEVLMISIHEDNLWPRTGGVQETAGGSAVNLPVPRGFNDSEMALAREALVLPLVQRFEPEAIILQCGADAVVEDPLAHLALSNNAHWAFLDHLMGVAPRLLVLGGGGYNPWSVARLWTGIWGTLNGFDIPALLPEPAQAVLRQLRFDGHRLGRNPPEHWFTTLRDAPRNGPISDEVAERIAFLQARHQL